MPQQPPKKTLDPDPFDAITLEFIECIRRGEQPNPQQFATLHPQFADRIIDLFPTIAAMEKLRDIKAESGDQQHSGIKLERLGDLRIIREVGRGGMGIVYEAEQESLDRRVAVKVLPTQMLLDAKRLARFKREARTVAKLHHTNIVPILGVGEHDGYHYYVMQLIEGVGLDEVMQNRGPQDPIAVANLGAQAASALHFAHQHGVLHRDIKPANLILDSAGVLWVADFGLSKGLESEAVTQTGDVLGTLRYMAPEQFLGKADHRSDVYSLGLTIYELLTRHPAHNEQLRRKAFVSGEAASVPVSPSELDANIPRDLETVVLKAIAAEPADRYQTAAEFADDLQCIVEDRPIQARRASLINLLWRWCRHNRALAAAVSVAAVAIVMVAMIATLKYYSTQELNAQVTSALTSARAALDDERIQRQKAESTSAIAWDALDEIFDRFAPRRVEPGELSSEDGDTGLSLRPTLSTEAAELLQNLLTYYNRLADEGDSSIGYQQRIAEANRRIGDIYQRLGKHKLAQSGYRRAVSIFQEVVNNADASDDTLDARIAVAAMTNELANIERSLNDRESELTLRGDAFRQLADIMELENIDLSKATYELARTLYFHGHLERSASGKPVQGDRIRQRLEWPRQYELPIGADQKTWSHGLNGRKAVRSAIELLELTNESPESRYLLARCYQDARNEHGQNDPAALLSAETTLQRLLDEFPAVADYRFALCLVLTTFEVRHADRKPADLALLKSRLQQAVSHSEQLVRNHPNEPAYQLLRARVSLKIASVPNHPRDPLKSRKTFESALRIHDDLVVSFPDSIPCQLARVTCKISAARYMNRMGETSSARSLAKDSIQLLEEMKKNKVPVRLISKRLADAKRQLDPTTSEPRR